MALFLFVLVEHWNLKRKLSVGGDVRVCVGFTQLYGRQ